MFTAETQRTLRHAESFQKDAAAECERFICDEKSSEIPKHGVEAEKKTIDDPLVYHSVRHSNRRGDWIDNAAAPADRPHICIKDRRVRVMSVSWTDHLCANDFKSIDTA